MHCGWQNPLTAPKQFRKQTGDQSWNTWHHDNRFLWSLICFRAWSGTFYMAHACFRHNLGNSNVEISQELLEITWTRHFSPYACFTASINSWTKSSYSWLEQQSNKPASHGEHDTIYRSTRKASWTRKGLHMWFLVNLVTWINESASSMRHQRKRDQIMWHRPWHSYINIRTQIPQHNPLCSDLLR